MFKKKEYKAGPKRVDCICGVCDKPFVWIRDRVGKKPGYCTDCRAKYGANCKYWAKTKHKNRASVHPVVVERTPAPFASLEGQHRNPEIEIVKALADNRYADGISFKASRNAAHIVGVCEHMIKYAEAEIQVNLEGKLIRILRIGVGAQGWTMKVLGPNANES